MPAEGAGEDRYRMPALGSFGRLRILQRLRDEGPMSAAEIAAHAKPKSDDEALDDSDRSQNAE